MLNDIDQMVEEMCVRMADRRKKRKFIHATEKWRMNRKMHPNKKKTRGKRERDEIKCLTMNNTLSAGCIDDDDDTHCFLARTSYSVSVLSASTYMHTHTSENVFG